MVHAIFKTNIQKCKLFTKTLFITFGNTGKPASLTCSKRKVLQNRHSRSSSPHRILIQSPDIFCSGMLWQKCNILSIQNNRSGICEKISTDGIKHSRFTSSVGTDNCCKIAFFKMKRQISDCHFFIYCSRIKGFGNM